MTRWLTVYSNTSPGIIDTNEFIVNPILPLILADVFSIGNPFRYAIIPYVLTNGIFVVTALDEILNDVVVAFAAGMYGFAHLIASYAR